MEVKLDAGTVRRLIGDCRGLVTHFRASDTDDDDDHYVIVNLTTPRLAKGGVSEDSVVDRGIISGVGVAPSEDDALVPAFGELIERYSAECFTEDDYVVASARDLGNHVLDLDELATCSDTEYNNAFCTLIRPSKDKPLRWTKGIDLLSTSPTWIPAVMAFTSAGWEFEGERFWHPISTGCAAHTSFEEALLRGIFEVVERDALAILWLHRLPLRVIDIDDDRSPERGHIQTVFFDATLELGIPTVYAIQVAPHHPYAHTICACATALSYRQAVDKVRRDLAAFRTMFRTKRNRDIEPARFTGLLDSAAYMALPQHAHAFNFLLESSRHIALSSLTAEERPLPLEEVLLRLRKKNLQTYAIDLTTDEARRCGLKVVRAIIPRMQPLSFHASSQFKANRRLYDLPPSLGYPRLTEGELNPWPQPFS